MISTTNKKTKQNETKNIWIGLRCQKLFSLFLLVHKKLFFSCFFLYPFFFSIFFHSIESTIMMMMMMIPYGFFIFFSFWIIIIIVFFVVSHFKCLFCLNACLPVYSANNHHHHFLKEIFFLFWKGHMWKTFEKKPLFFLLIKSFLTAVIVCFIFFLEFFLSNIYYISMCSLYINDKHTNTNQPTKSMTKLHLHLHHIFKNKDGGGKGYKKNQNKRLFTHRNMMMILFFGFHSFNPLLFSTFLF